VPLLDAQASALKKSAALTAALFFSEGQQLLGTSVPK
jgi:hypothetical protein